MVFKLNNNLYNLSVFWATTTLRQAVEITSIEINESKLEKLLEDDGSEVFDKEIYNYLRKVISILSDCPMKELEQTYDAEIGAIWDVISYIVKSLYLVKFDNYKPRGMKSIQFKGKTYNMPESLILNEEEILAYKEPSINIVEVNNLALYLSEMKSKGLNSMKYICAILLKEDKHEIYDEEKIAKRAKEFEDLPMNVVFECFFFIYYFSNNYLISSLNFLPQELQKRNLKTTIRGYMQLLKQGWLVISKWFRK